MLHAMEKVAAGACLVAALLDCSSANPGAVQSTPNRASHPVKVAMTPKVRAENILAVRYSGKWEFISHRADGRFRGDSVRSFRPGDSITVVFSGSRLRIYGIRGRNGGTASVVLPDAQPVEINFYAPAKETHALLYDSGPLNGTIQTAGIIVVAPQPSRRQGYVNIDEMETLTR